MRAIFFALLFFAFPHFLRAQENSIPLNAAQSYRAEMLCNELRCVVCQNENIQNSSSPLASQLRSIIRQKIVDGASNKQIKQYMVQRYGVFILLKPPFSTVTFLLYGSPFFALILGGWLFYLNSRQLRNHLPLLTKAETSRIDELLK